MTGYLLGAENSELQMVKIIFLNGCGSSGKSSIAQAVQQLSKESWLTFGVDSFINMTPEGREGLYYSLISGENERGPTMHVKVTSQGNKLFGLMPNFAALLADNSHNIIIDEVLLDDELLKNYIKFLQNHTVYFIGVLCDLKTMQQREIQRQDRAIGLSNDQIDRVHNGLREYDLEVNTTSASPSELAKQILDFIAATSKPNGFINMLAKL